MPRGAGGLTRFVAAAGGRTGLLRQIELRTGAKPAFVLSGIPGSVGSGSRALWTELAARRREARTPALRVWPFDGSLRELSREPGLVLAETYPRASYALALAPRLPAPPEPLGKTRRPVREEALRRLRAAAWRRRSRTALADLDRAAASEDDFDALLTAAALARVLAEGEPLASWLVDPGHEGGILGTRAVGGAGARPPRLRPPRPARAPSAPAASQGSRNTRTY